MKDYFKVIINYFTKLFLQNINFINFIVFSCIDQIYFLVLNFLNFFHHYQKNQDCKVQ
jgi:hypothetical protein